MKDLGLLDFEIFLIIVMMVLDIVLGTIDHNFFIKDSSSNGAIRSLMKKLGIASLLITILIVLHSRNFINFSGIDSFINMIQLGADSVVVMLLYYELISILAHLHNITGLDFSNIPMVKQELKMKDVTQNDSTK